MKSSVDKNASSSFVNLVASSWFLNLWKVSTESYSSYEDIKRIPLPDGYPSNVWDCITALKKYAGVVMPYELYLPVDELDRGDEESRDVFYYPSKDIVSSLAIIEERCNLTSDSARAISAFRASSSVLLLLVINEIKFVLERDGVILPSEVCHGIVLNTRVPASKEEVLFSRVCNLFLSAEKYANRDLTMGLMELLYEQLVDGITALPPKRSRVEDEPGYALWEADKTMRVACSLGNVTQKDMHPILAVHNMETLLWDHVPLPSLNNTVGFLLRKVCFERYGFPVLAYTSFAQSCICWQKGIPIDEPILPSYDLTQGMRISSYGYDSTAYQLGLLAIDLYNIRQLEHRINRYDQLKTVLKSVFHNTYHFNVRQSEILAMLFERPCYEFSTYEYCNKFDVSYTTARTDLSVLCEMEFLIGTYKSRTKTYRVGPEYKNLLKGFATKADSI